MNLIHVLYLMFCCQNSCFFWVQMLGKATVLYNFVVYQCQTSWHLRWPIGFQGQLLVAHAVIDLHPCANTMPGDVREPYSPRNRGGVRRNPRQGHATARGGARVAAEAVAEKRLPAVQGDGKVPPGSMGFEVEASSRQFFRYYLLHPFSSIVFVCFSMGIRAAGFGQSTMCS